MRDGVAQMQLDAEQLAERPARLRQVLAETDAQAAQERRAADLDTRYELKGSPAMAMIKIEQDSPEVIGRVRKEIASTVRRIASGNDRHAELMMFVGYCRALCYERLISLALLEQLDTEMERAVDTPSTENR